MIILIFILIQDYLTYIHPGLSGIVLLIIVIWAIILLYQGGTRVAGEITKTLDYVGEQAVKIIEGERADSDEETPKNKR